MHELQTWAAQWGDMASVAGLVLSMIGFTVTIVGVRRSRSAAEQARQAAIATRESIALHDAIADLSSATAIMEEIKRLQRHGVWSVLPDRYSELRRWLVAIRGSRAGLDEEQRQALQLAIEAFAVLERTVERAVADRKAPPNPPKLNELVAAELDRVQTVLLAVQRMQRSA